MIGSSEERIFFTVEPMEQVFFVKSLGIFIGDETQIGKLYKKK